MFAEYLRGGVTNSSLQKQLLHQQKWALIDGFRQGDLSSFPLPQSTSFILLLTFHTQFSLPQVNWNWDLDGGLWNSLSCIMDVLYVNIYQRWGSNFNNADLQWE